MAKKTRTELSTSAINTNLPDNTQELITPTTERAQLTDERESVINYKDDLGGTGNAGKFLTVAADGESLTMVDAPTGDVTGTGVAAQVTFWNGTSSITSDAMLVVDDTNKILKIIIPTENASGGISIDQQGTTGSGSLQFLDDGLYKAQIVYDVTDGDLTLNSNGDIKITPTGDTVISGGTPIVEHVRIKSEGDVGIGTDLPSAKLTIDLGDGSSAPTTFTTSNSYLQLGTTSYNTAGAVYSIGFGYTGGSINSPAYIGLKQTDTGNATKGDLVFLTRDSTNDIAPTERLRISSGGIVSIPNGIVFNNNTTGGTPNATGVTLNDYEEGTYTATMTPNTSGTITLNNNTLSYTRTGRVVHVTGYIDFASVSSPVGSVNINLPFTQSTDAKFATACNVRFNGFSNSSYYANTPWAQCSNGVISIYSGNQPGVLSNVAQEITTSCSVRIGVTYFTNA